MEIFLKKKTKNYFPRSTKAADIKGIESIVKNFPTIQYHRTFKNCSFHLTHIISGDRKMSNFTAKLIRKANQNRQEPLQTNLNDYRRKNLEWNKIMHGDLVGIVPGMLIWFDIRKLIHETSPINGMKGSRKCIWRYSIPSQA